MLKVKTAFFATDEQDSEVLVMPGYQISEITDAGPEIPIAGVGVDNATGKVIYEPIGWNVTFRITNRHWTELVTCDAIKLLKALE